MNRREHASSSIGGGGQIFGADSGSGGWLVFVRACVRTWKECVSVPFELRLLSDGARVLQEHYCLCVVWDRSAVSGARELKERRCMQRRKVPVVVRR